MSYFSIPYPTPDSFKNLFKNKSVLIIGTGHSTKKLVPYKNILRNKFDLIIGLNFSTRDFEDQLDFHMVLEKNPVKVYSNMKPGTYSKKIPRILNWKSIDKFPNDIDVIKATRCSFNGKPNIRKYSKDNQEGLLIGPQGNKGLSIGTVALNAIHFAGILGCSNIYMIGVDLLFKDSFDHYYPDNHYRKSTTKLANRSPIIDIEFKNKIYKTTIFFKESAKYIDKIISTLCKKEGINVYDFSNGLITKAINLDINAFMS